MDKLLLLLRKEEILGMRMDALGTDGFGGSSQIHWPRAQFLVLHFVVPLLWYTSFAEISMASAAPRFSFLMALFLAQQERTTWLRSEGAVGDDGYA